MQRKKVVNKNGPYVIEKSIPMERKRNSSTRFPFDKMKIGDSFFVPKEDQEPHLLQVSLYSAARSYNKTHRTKIKCSSRREGDGTRVWRIQ